MVALVNAGWFGIVAGPAGGLTSLSFVSANHASATTGTTASVSVPTCQAGDIGVFSFVFDNGSRTLNTPPAGWTSVVSTFGDSEYPEGSTYIKILDGTETTVAAVIDSSLYDWACTCAVFRPNSPATTLTVTDFDSYNGGSSASINIDAATNSNGDIATLVYGYVSGRPISQNPVGTLTPTGDAYTQGSACSHYTYALYDVGDTIADHTWATTDAGRQAIHGLCVEVT
jgi:hypothetical protein